MRITGRATPLFLGLLFVLLLSAQLLLYRDSFAVKPSSDDFIALHQVDRGEAEGVWTFFMASDAGDYRPLQNVTFWFFGRFSKRHMLLSLRVLHFLSVIFYAMVAFLWIRTLGFNRIGAAGAACVVFLHPTLAGPLAGLDNYTRLVVSAWVWLGAWVAYRWGGRRLLAIPLVSLCFAIALGYTEYALTLIPLAVLATAWRGERRQFHSAWVMCGSLMTIFCAYFLIRVSGMVATTAGMGFLSLNPLVWVKNTAMIVVAVLFFGNTVPVMQEASLPSLAWLGSNVTLVALALGYGLWAGRRSLVPPVGRVPQVSSPAEVSLPPHLRFLGAAFAVAFFPMLLMSHVSEIYLSAVTLALALLTGLSTHGWMAASRTLRYLALFLAGSQLLLAGNAIQGKVAGIKEAGERTETMMQRLLEHLPSDGATKRVAMVFLKKKAAAGKGYSIFAMPDDELVPQASGTFAARWFRPDRDIRLDSLVVTDPSVVDLKSYDLVLLWEDSRREFSLMRRSATLEGCTQPARHSNGQPLTPVDGSVVRYRGI